MSVYDLGIVPIPLPKSGAERDCLLRFSGTPTNLWDQEVDPERRILVIQEAFQLCDLLPQHVGRVADAADNTQAAGVGDCGGEFRTGGDVHAGEHDGVVDLEEIGRCGAELL